MFDWTLAIVGVGYDQHHRSKPTSAIYIKKEFIKPFNNLEKFHIIPIDPIGDING